MKTDLFRSLRRHLSAAVPIAAIPLAALTIAMTACSNGSSAGGPPPRVAGASLFVDTAAGVQDTLTVQVLAVVAERIDGSLSSNLLAQPSALTLADPRGGTVGLALSGQPAGAAHVALRMLLDGAASRAARGDGSFTTVRLPSTELRLPIDGGQALADGDSLELAHATPPQFTVAADGALDARLDLVLRAPTELPVRGLTARVAAVDLQARAITATLPDVGDLAVRLTFDDRSALFGDDGARRGVDDFLRGCRGDSELRVDAVRRGDDDFVCSAAEHQHRGRSSEPQFTGRVGSIDATAMRFTLDATARRGTDGRSQPFRATLTVDASGAAFRRSLGGGAHTPATFADLTADALVEVEGSEGQDGVLVAREVDLEDEPGRRAGGEIEGAVVAVDPVAGRITVGPRRDDPLLVAGRRVDRVEVLVGAGTALFRDGESPSSIGLADVRTTDRVWVRGAVAADGTVEASSVRVRDDAR